MIDGIMYGNLIFATSLYFAPMIIYEFCSPSLQMEVDYPVVCKIRKIVRDIFYYLPSHDAKISKIFREITCVVFPISLVITTLFEKDILKFLPIHKRINFKTICLAICICVFILKKVSSYLINNWRYTPYYKQRLSNFFYRDSF